MLGLLVALIPANGYLIIGVDETLERRKGKKIAAKGCYRDAVRSSHNHIVYCFGLKWISMMLIVTLPFSSRPWALPFLTVLAPSKAYNEERGKRHKTTIDWTVQMVMQVRRWLGERMVLLVADGGFACVYLAQVCLRCGWGLVSKLRLDAQLYDFPETQSPHKKGPKSSKGKKLPPLKERIREAKKQGKKAVVKWYGGKKRTIRFLSGVCLWYTPGQAPLPIRWVLVVDPTAQLRTEAFFSTDLNLSPIQIVETYVLRWNVEVTFEESREHLGVETQRQWSDQAIQRTTPALLALFSLTTLIALNLSKTQPLHPKTTAWYQKQNLTFSDVLNQVRYHIWSQNYFTKSNRKHDFIYLDPSTWNNLLLQLADTA